MRRTIVNDSVPVEAADCWLWQQSRRIKRSEQRGEHVVDFVETSAECPTECPECPAATTISEEHTRSTLGDHSDHSDQLCIEIEIVLYVGAEKDAVLPKIEAV